MVVSGEHSHTPRPDVIARLMRERGLTREKLADKAPVAINTLRSVLAGKPAVMATLKKIARVLEVSPAEIIDSDPQGLDMREMQAGTIGGKERRKAGVQIARAFTSFDETTELPALIEAIRKEIDAKHTIYIIAIAPGRVVITLELDAEDAQKLEEAFRQGRLKAMGVTRVFLDSAVKTPDDEPPLARLN
jgi:transcriptional regulator with XRE-family HTH domain